MIIPFEEFNKQAIGSSNSIVTQSSSMRDLIRLAKRAASSSATVLITGESGSGKELFAQIIHKQSQRDSQKYIKVNCAALSENLIESELFGHEKGSFTDAFQRRIGRFEYANGGTLLLDEVTEIPMTTQAKLLRALEENEIQRVGCNEIISIDVRVVATSNRDIRTQIRNNSFRHDLFHRLNVIQIQIPPLRERTTDVLLLAEFFIDKFRNENPIQIKGLSKSAIDFLKKYHWPGNVRELRNCIHRACVMTNRPFIDEYCFKNGLEIEQSIREETTIPNQWLNNSLEETEKQIIISAIDLHKTQKRAAEVLGVTTRTLSSKMRKYRLSSRNAA